MVISYGEELLLPRLTSKVGDQPLSLVRSCLFSIFAATLRTWRPFPPSASSGRVTLWWHKPNYHEFAQIINFCLSLVYLRRFSERGFIAARDIKNKVTWDVTPYSLVDKYQGLVWNFCLYKSFHSFWLAKILAAMTERRQERCSCFPPLANSVSLPLHMGLAPSIPLENSTDPILTTD